VIAELCDRTSLVLAAGGGAPLREESRRKMRASGRVIWLKARPETIHRRMTADATTAERRPSLTEYDPVREIVELLERREPIYRETAHWELDTEGKSPQKLASEILAQLRESAE